MVNIKNALASGEYKIGSLIWYDCRNASITPQQLKTLFSKHNLNTRFFPQSIRPKNAFQKACRKAMAESGQSSDTRRSITKLIIDGSEKLVYGVVDLDVNESAQEIQPDFSDRVWFDKGSMSVGFDHGHETSRKIQQHFNTLCGEYTTRDISRMVTKTLEKLCSVSLRDAGVIYFVPVAFEDDLQALQAVVNDVGQCNMRVFALASNDGNVGGIKEAARSQINDKIDKLKKDIAHLKSSMEVGSIKGASLTNSIDVRMKRFTELKEQCSILADALHVKADSLLGDLDKVGDLIKNELHEAA